MESYKVLLVLMAIINAFSSLEAKPTSDSGELPCKSTYCFEKPDNYPQELINELLRSLNFQKRDNYTEPTRIADRTEVNECQVETIVKPIHQILDEQGRRRIVVQSEQYMQQILEVIICKSPGPLEDVVDPLVCEQEHLDYNFLVLSEDNTKLDIAKVKKGVPVGCLCRFLPDYNN